MYSLGPKLVQGRQRQSCLTYNMYRSDAQQVKPDVRASLPSICSFLPCPNNHRACLKGCKLLGTFSGVLGVSQIDKVSEL